MKRHILYIVACLALFGCSDTYDEGLGLTLSETPRFLGVSETELFFESQPETKQTLAVTSRQTPWKIENGIDWVNVSPISGNASANVDVEVTENKSGENARTGIFFLKSNADGWNAESAISVTQEGATPNIELSLSELDFSGTFNMQSITVRANCSWKMEPSEEWVTVSQKDSVITVSVDANESYLDRTATVLFSHEGIEYAYAILTIRQAPADINASTESIVVNNDASEVEVTIDAEAAWVASSSNSWIDILPSSGNAGKTVMTISISPNTSTNDRTGFVNLFIGEIQRIRIPIMQRGIYIETDQKELTFSSSGESKNLSVLSNTNWRVASSPYWLSVSPSAGEGNGTIKVTAPDNPYTASRSGIIRLTQAGLNIETSVIVTQSGKELDVSATVLNFGSENSIKTIDVKTSGTWTASTSTAWISVSPSTASGNSTLSVSVSENTSDNERVGQITLVMADKSITINVIQKGKYLTVSNSLLNYTSKGGIIDVSITTDDSWTAKVEEGAGWLSLSNSLGTGNAYIQITAADNPSVNSRTATILVETQYSQPVRIVVTQDARYLKVNTHELLFYAKGGDSETVTIETDGVFNLTYSGTWFSVRRSGKTFTVHADENTTKAPRIGTIDIMLTDLQEGTYSISLPVVQLNSGGSFLRKDYDDDQNWDGQKEHTNGTLTIKGYGTDSNYDADAAGSVTLTVTGYASESNWDANGNGSVTVTITGFKDDSNFDSNTNTAGTVSKTEFEGDKNWQ